MNKLEPILKYHFWILLFVALVMAMTGWWMTTGQMKAAITDRRNKIADAKKKIPDPKNHPSKDWEEKLTAINAEQDKLIRSSRNWLYARQKERMVWPSWIPEAAQLKYREPFKDSRRNIIYRDNYLKEVMRIYEIPRPITDSQEPEGVVYFPFSEMPHREWGDTPPSNQQIWDSMEDLWLLEPLLQAVLETNGGANATRDDASIVAIEYIKLHGGDRSKIGQATETASASGASGMGAGMPAMGAMGGDDGKADRMGNNAAAMSGPGSTSTDIKPVEEFGDPGSDNAGGGDTAGASPGAMPGLPGGADIRPGMNAGSASGRNEEVGRRYIDDEQGAPYRTRGFKLTVVMDHRKVPDLYAQLTSSERSPWPVKILRMNIADFKEAGSMGIGGDGDGGRRGGRPIGANAGGAGAFPGMAGRPAGPGGMLGGMMKGGRGQAMGRGDRDDVFSGNPAGAASNDQMEKPTLARVTFVGLITLYNEPPQSETTTSPSATPTETAAEQPAAAGEAAAGDEASETAVDEETMDADADPATEPAEEAMTDEESDETPKPDSDLDDPDMQPEGETDAPENPAGESPTEEAEVDSTTGDKPEPDEEK